MMMAIWSLICIFRGGVDDFKIPETSIPGKAALSSENLKIYLPNYFIDCNWNAFHWFMTLLPQGEEGNCYLWRGKRGRGGCCRDKRGGGRTTTSKFRHDSFMMMLILKVLLWCITSGGEGPVSRTWVWSRGPWGKGIITTVIFNHFRAGDLKTWIAPWQCGWRRWRRISKVASPSGWKNRFLVIGDGTPRW